MTDKCTFFNGRAHDPDFIDDLREFLADQADAEYHPEAPRLVPSEAMRLLARLDELFPEEK